MTSPNNPLRVDAVLDAGAAKPKRKVATSRKRVTAQSSKESHKAIVESLAKYLVMGTVLYSSYVVSGIEHTADEEVAAVMTDDEASAIADPIAKLIERSALSHYAGAIVGGQDWLLAIAAAWSYGQRVAPLQRRKNAVTAATKPVRQSTRRKVSTNGRVRPNAEADAGFPGAGPTEQTIAGYGLGPQQSTDL